MGGLVVNIERLKIIIDAWYDYLDKENIDELEKDIGMSFKDFVIQILESIYNYYIDIISYIPVESDKNSEYIIKPQNGVYSLEDFLINRLLRNISTITYSEPVIISSSEYDHTFGSVTIDKNRLKKDLDSTEQRRKIVAHELLHGLKTQFNDHNVFRVKEYYSLKEKLKKQIYNVINDFSYSEGIGQNGLHSHSGLVRKKDIFNMENIDEIFNEIDAIRFFNDKKMVVAQLEDDVYVVLRNPESSNAFITNYAYIIERLLDKKTLFIGMYFNPDVVINNINKLYNQIFQKNYNSDKTAIEIIIGELSKIKKDPALIDRPLLFLETLHQCLEQKVILNDIRNQEYYSNITSLGQNGLLQIRDGKLKPHSSLSYYKEYDDVRNNR